MFSTLCCPQSFLVPDLYGCWMSQDGTGGSGCRQLVVTNCNLRQKLSVRGSLEHRGSGNVELTRLMHDCRWHFRMYSSRSWTCRNDHRWTRTRIRRATKKPGCVGDPLTQVFVRNKEAGRKKKESDSWRILSCKSEWTDMKGKKRKAGKELQRGEKMGFECVEQRVQQRHYSWNPINTVVFTWPI